MYYLLHFSPYPCYRLLHLLIASAHLGIQFYTWILDWNVIALDTTPTSAPKNTNFIQNIINQYRARKLTIDGYRNVKFDRIMVFKAINRYFCFTQSNDNRFQSSLSTTFTKLYDPSSISYYWSYSSRSKYFSDIGVLILFIYFLAFISYFSNAQPSFKRQVQKSSIQILFRRYLGSDFSNIILSQRSTSNKKFLSKMSLRLRQTFSHIQMLLQSEKVTHLRQQSQIVSETVCLSQETLQDNKADVLFMVLGLSTPNYPSMHSNSYKQQSAILINCFIIVYLIFLPIIISFLGILEIALNFSNVYGYFSRFFRVQQSFQMHLESRIRSISSKFETLSNIQAFQSNVQNTIFLLNQNLSSLDTELGSNIKISEHSSLKSLKTPVQLPQNPQEQLFCKADYSSLIALPVGSSEITQTSTLLSLVFLFYFFDIRLEIMLRFSKYSPFFYFYRSTQSTCFQWKQTAFAGSYTSFSFCQKFRVSKYGLRQNLNMLASMQNQAELTLTQGSLMCTLT